MPADGSRPPARAPFKLPLHPRQPERVCWGCDKYCPADALVCGNGSERTPHPSELFGDDWYEWVHPGATERAAALREEALGALERLASAEDWLKNPACITYELSVDEEANARLIITASVERDSSGLARAAESCLLAVPGMGNVRVDFVRAPVRAPSSTPAP